LHESEGDAPRESDPSVTAKTTRARQFAIQYVERSSKTVGATTSESSSMSAIPRGSPVRKVRPQSRPYAQTHGNATRA